MLIVRNFFVWQNADCTERVNAGQIHLHQGFLDRALPPSVTLDNGCLKRNIAQLGNLQAHTSCFGIQLALVVTRPIIAPAVTAFIAIGANKSVRFRVKQRIQGLFNRTADNPAQMVLNAFVINVDDITQQCRVILCHGGFSCRWLILRKTSLRQFRGRQPHSQMCETFCTLSSFAHNFAAGARAAAPFHSGLAMIRRLHAYFYNNYL